MSNWFTIDQIDETTYIISEYRHWEETHCYLLIGRERCLLIDTGLGICNIYDEVCKLTDKPITAIATHIHWDHIGGHTYFPDFYAHRAELDWLNGKFPLPIQTVRNMVIDRCDLPDGYDVNTYQMFQGTPTKILDGGDTPIAWNGKNHADYLSFLMQSFAADYEGRDQMMLNYNLGNGTVKQATNLGKIVGGKFVRDAEPTTITNENGYETMRQQGKYEGLNFVRWLVAKGNDKYHNSLAFNGAYSHMNAQEDFLLAGIDGETAPIAMLVDGIWWESEATATFNSNASKYGNEYSKKNRRFGFMPLPKANAEKVAEARESDKQGTLIDHIYSICFMKKNIADWKKPIALDFIKFVHSDESLAEFTTITNTPKAFRYSMSEAQLNEMSPFGRSVIKMKENSDIVYPYSTNSVYIQNQSSFSAANMYAISSTVRYPASDLREKQTSAESYFTSMCNYYKNGWSSKLN